MANAKIRNKNGEARSTQYGVAEVDGVLTVPEAAVYGFTCQGGWEPVDKAATKAHEDAEKDAAVLASGGTVVRERGFKSEAEMARSSKADG